MENLNHTKLIKAIISMSKSDNWKEAKEEWYKINLQKDCEGKNCACGHKIHNIIIIKNRHTNKMTRVGCVCINKFKSKYFKKYNDKDFNDINLTEDELIEAHNAGVISSWDYRFYLDVLSFDCLSLKQRHFKNKIYKSVCDYYNRLPIVNISSMLE